jgi:8-oxo-dGTP pyrophosphatase MutT (NUDIX family)
LNQSDSNRGLNQRKTQGVRHGVVAVCCEGDKYLVIRRSELVRAPGLLCFPGGHIEPEESAIQAVIREMNEELALPIEVIRHLWSSVTQWGTHLEWIHVRRPLDPAPVPNPQEVADVMWLTESELLGCLDVLGSVSDFFEAKYSGLFSLES